MLRILDKNLNINTVGSASFITTPTNLTGDSENLNRKQHNSFFIFHILYSLRHPTKGKYWNVCTTIPGRSKKAAFSFACCYQESLRIWNSFISLPQWPCHCITIEKNVCQTISVRNVGIWRDCIRQKITCCKLLVIFYKVLSTFHFHRAPYELRA